MICESHERECDVCELIERGVRSAGAYYFAGMMAVLYHAERRTPLCSLHFAEWKKLETAAKADPIVTKDAAQ